MMQEGVKGHLAMRIQTSLPFLQQIGRFLNDTHHLMHRVITFLRIVRNYMHSPDDKRKIDKILSSSNTIRGLINYEDGVSDSVVTVSTDGCWPFHLAVHKNHLSFLVLASLDVLLHNMRERLNHQNGQTVQHQVRSTRRQLLNTS
jgi:hypothetical protein